MFKMWSNREFTNYFYNAFLVHESWLHGLLMDGQKWWENNKNIVICGSNKKGFNGLEWYEGE